MSIGLLFALAIGIGQATSAGNPAAAGTSVERPAATAAEAADGKADATLPADRARLHAAFLAAPDVATARTLQERFLRESTLQDALDSYAVLDSMGFPDALAVDSCREQGPQLAKARIANPFSAALHAAAARCFELLDRSDDAELAGAALDAVFELALGEGRGQSLQQPAMILFDIDALALVQAAGLDLIDGSYVLTNSPRQLPMRLFALDPSTGGERILWFDFLDAWLRLSRDDEGAEFPMFGRATQLTYLETQAKSGNSFAMIPYGGVLVADDPARRKEARAMLDGAAANAPYSAIMTLAEECFVRPALWGCSEPPLDDVITLAEEGRGRALVFLAAAYASGYGVKRDAKAADEFLQRAKQRLGKEVATRLLVGLLSIRDGMDQDLSRVTEDLLRDGAKDDAQIAYLLATFIRADQAAGSDREARKWLQRSAEAGWVLAMADYGVQLVSSGEAVAGRAWLEKAAAAANPQAAAMLGVMDDSDVPGARNWASAERWYRAAAWNGSAVAMRRLGLAYLEGGSAAKADPQAAMGWLESATWFDDVPAALALAELYVDPPAGTPARFDDAVRIYQVLAQLGNTEASIELALLSLDGKAKDIPPAQGLERLQRVADSGSARAAYELGLRYEKGPGVAADAAEAVRWYRKSARQDYPAALDMLAHAYRHGLGVARDDGKARDYWRRGAALGDTESRNNLAWLVCTSADRRLRDAEEGGRAITRAIVDQRDSTSVDTLAACEAAAGRFEEAARRQKEAIVLAEEETPDDAARLSAMRDRLALYQAGRSVTY